MKFLGYIFRLILKPQSGWEDISESNRTEAEWLRSGLYPMLGILAICCFVHSMYGDFDIGTTLEKAIIEFISYFAGLFIANEILCWYVNKEKETDGIENAESKDEINQKVKIFTTFNVGILVLISIVKNLFPVDNTIFVLLPYCILFVISDSGSYIGIQESKRIIFYFIAWLSIMAPTIIINQLLSASLL